MSIFNNRCGSRGFFKKLTLAVCDDKYLHDERNFYMNKNQPHEETRCTWRLCPLLAVASIGSTDTSPRYCAEDNCALWNTISRECAIVCLPESIQDLCEMLRMQNLEGGGSCL